MVGKRLLIVEDDPLAWRAMSRQLLDYELAWAQTLADASKFLSPARWKAQPMNAVCLDLILGDGDASSLLPVLARLNPRPGVVVVSAYLSPERLIELYRQRVLAIPKGCDARTLREAIATAMEAPAYLRLARTVCKRRGLTAMESDIVCAAVEGLTSHEAAERLGCSARTLDTHWQRIFNKLGYRSKQEVIAFVLRML